MTTTILITGASGFIGTQFAKAAKAEGWRAVGLDRRAPRPEILRSELFSDFETADLGITEILTLMKRNSVDAVAHFAAANSSSSAEEIYLTNIIGLNRLTEAIRSYGKKVALLVVGSSAEYGDGSSVDTRIDEGFALSPASPYGISKVASFHLASNFYKLTGMPVYYARPFNVVGVGQSNDFVIPRIASQLINIRRGSQETTLKLRGTESIRDFIDVRDVVRGLISLVKKGKPGEAYNICSGRPVSIRQALDIMIKAVAISVHIELEGANTSVLGVQCQRGSYDKILRDTGWLPEIPLEQSLSDILDALNNGY